MYLPFTLDQLMVLESVAKWGGVRIAAAKLRRSQPSISVAMKELENKLGLKIFDRSKYRIHLTDIGLEILKQSKNVLRESEKLAESASQYEEGFEPIVKLSVDAIVDQHQLLNVLCAFREEFPKTKLHLNYDILYTSYQKVIRGESHLALTPFIKDDSLLRITKLKDYQLDVIASPKFIPDKRMSLIELKEIPQIIVSQKDQSADDSNHRVTDVGEKWVVSDHEMKRKLILSGLGWGSLECSSIQAELSTGELHIIKVPQIPSEKLTLRLIHLKNKSLGKPSLFLFEKIKKQFLI